MMACARRDARARARPKALILKQEPNSRECWEKNDKPKKNAKSQFWLRITRKVDATGPDFGCKFRLRRSPGASESVFGAETMSFFSKEKQKIGKKKEQKNKKTKNRQISFLVANYQKS